MSDKVRVVLVGCGGMSGAWLKVATALPDVEQVGLVDLHRPAAEKRAAEFNLPPSLVFDTLGAALEATEPDAVFDVTVPVAHDAVTIEALEAGCHVLGEKPMSDTLEKARRMAETARRTGKLYAITQTRRPSAKRTQDFVRSGVIGDVQEVHSDFFVGARFGGFRGEMDHPLIVDMAIHTFDNARQIGDMDPVSVYCHAWNPAHSWYRGDASAVCIFEMKGPRGPVVYTYRGSWTNEGHHTDWNADWRIVGTKGTIRWDGGNKVTAQVVKDLDSKEFFRPLETIEAPPMRLDHYGHEYMIREFVEAVKSGGAKWPWCPAEDNIKSFAMVIAAVESAKRGQRVAVEW